MKKSGPAQPALTILGTFRRFWGHMKLRRKRQVSLLVVPVLVAGFAEMISVGAIIPFLSVLASPETMFKLDAVVQLSFFLGLESADQLRLPLTILFCAAMVGASALRLLILWLNSKLSFAITHDVSVEVYRRSLYQPYSVQIARNSSKLLGGIAKSKSITASLNTVFSLVSGLWIGLFIVIALLLVNTQVALISFVGFGTVYLVTTMLTRGRFARNGKMVAEAQTARFKAMQDGVGGIRDVLLDGNQPFFAQLFRKVDLPMSRAQASTNFLSNSPRYIIEPIGVILIVLIAYRLSLNPGGFSAMIPTLGALALGAQRLLPVLQQVYTGWATLKTNHASLVDVVEFLDQPIPAELELKRPAPLHFQRLIEFRDVWFRYHETGPYVLRGVNVTISKGQRIGFLGATGSGKSTLLDMLMALLEPSRGEILIDGKLLTGADRLAWQRSIAHVPQAIYLADASLAENIAFGVPLKEIDMNRVRGAARQAQIADFIEGTDEGYMTRAGERGVRISGGQRQRIGIARALYKNASVLVFDEATSALDNETERSVMEAIEGLGRDFTICMIAHRLTTLRNCDLIMDLHEGMIRATGSYEELVESAASIR
ncbi:MAG: ABC transporter ATP-binding protein [Parvibaculum sp.]